MEGDNFHYFLFLFCGLEASHTVAVSGIGYWETLFMLRPNLTESEPIHGQQSRERKPLPGNSKECPATRQTRKCKANC